MAALRKGIQNNNSLISVNAAGHQVNLPMSCKKLNFCIEFTEHCDYNFHGKKNDSCAWFTMMHLCSHLQGCQLTVRMESFSPNFTPLG